MGDLEILGLTKSAFWDYSLSRLKQVLHRLDKACASAGACGAWRRDVAWKSSHSYGVMRVFWGVYRNKFLKRGKYIGKNMVYRVLPKKIVVFAFFTCSTVVLFYDS